MAHQMTGDLRLGVLPPGAASLLPGVAIREPGHDHAIAGLAVRDVPPDFLRGPRNIQLELAQGLAGLRRELDRPVRCQVLDGRPKWLALLIPLRPLLHTLLCRHVDLADLCHSLRTCCLMS